MLFSSKNFVFWFYVEKHFAPENGGGGDWHPPLPPPSIAYGPNIYF